MNTPTPRPDSALTLEIIQHVPTADRVTAAEGPVAFNYRYMIGKAAEIGGRILDYGCGRGEMVQHGLNQGLDIWGADTYEGFYSVWSEDLPSEIVPRIRRIEADCAPYPDGHFDLVLSNYVLEHVAHPEAVFRDVYRVLKPGGVFLAAFATSDTWYEGHVGVYFAHWLPNPSRALDAYLELCFNLGMGRYREHNTRESWRLTMASMLAQSCRYRPGREVLGQLNSVFNAESRSLAADYMRARLALNVPTLADPLLAALFFTRGGHILAITKPVS